MSSVTRVAVLHLEDEPKDSRLLKGLLSADGIECEMTRVDNEPDFRAAIEKGGFDVIFADHSLPTFDGLSALAIARDVCPEVPFICVSGSLGEEIAIEALKQGATDYVLKQRPGRLVPALRRALQDSAKRANLKRAENEVRELEDRLRHSQKLEAVGQLAGGIAHDFNNLLTVINGYCDRLGAALGDANPLRHDLDLIQRAGQRAAALTRQLLAFSRRQVLQPHVFDLNSVVHDIQMMLGRLLGEHITIATRLAPDLGAVRADPGQIEQVMMNLSINARDAMPDGGTLTVETHNVDLTAEDEPRAGLKAGLYVALVIRDTGTGMDEGTLAHVFEPFYTTKETGKGTGLGLPTVYGIVMQSGGNVRIESVVGEGTTVHVLLPRVDAAAAPSKGEAAPAQVTQGRETVLLVEDEELVRELVHDFLAGAGYDVIEASDAEQALRIAGTAGVSIDAVVTDVVLPGMNGSDLAARLREMSPRIRVLYVSGYPGAGVFGDGGFGPGSDFLAKPFTRQMLTQKLRDMLDAPATGS